MNSRHTDAATPAPSRIQLRRTAGWRLPGDAVSVAYPTKWANPHRPADRTPEANAAAVALYREHLRSRPDLITASRAELAGKRLACWCPLELTCHADVLDEVRRGAAP
jgi:hypothetical protein